LLVFRSNPVGSRQGRIVLAQYRGPADPDTEWRHAKVVLSPLNPDYKPIVIPPESADDFRIIAEFIAVL
jgi:SOS-response transcriptional repressor LexA